ncbi:MAG: DNA cytosine methyltransferase [Propioniciclava sp.]|uniref:DNA cytosine methyltransferase n=1 Tax=Propioniciclava sp. TaxID=2038686 RepID=UPI0039E5361A
MALTSLEICAGAGGQALGLEQAGFDHLALVEIDTHACRTLRTNRPEWRVEQEDLLDWRPSADLRGQDLDLLAGGVPCPPFSKAGKQRGADDERDLFPAALTLVKLLQPRAVMLENVRGLLDPVFADYRRHILDQLADMNYVGEWRLLHASDFGVPQLRPRAILVALREQYAPHFVWPEGSGDAPTVGEALKDLMGDAGWLGLAEWCEKARTIAPTLVGGSKKHGGPDLGPTRARRAWAELGVNGSTIAEAAPDRDFVGMPRLTVRMAARLQGFPDDWQITGAKTNAYRQVGNAFPPPVARAVGKAIADALKAGDAAGVGTPVALPIRTPHPLVAELARESA